MDGVMRLLESALARDPESVNTDWDGTLLMRALQEWEKATDEKRYGDYVARWYEHHAKYDPQKSDQEIYKTFSGPKCRIVRESPIPFTAYCGHWGLAYICEGVEARRGDGHAKRLAAAVADFILHDAARSHHGAVYHDDHTRFLIPDTCFFAAPPLAIAARLTGRDVYLEHAVRQVLAYARLMQDEASGLAFTFWTPDGMPRNFWTRASGWLAGAFVGTLEYLPREHDAYAEVAERLRALVEGVARVQEPSGDLHVLLDRPDAPVDSTGPAMIATAVRRGLNLGVLDESSARVGDMAWQACTRFIKPDGRVTGAYTGWAKTAVEERLDAEMFDKPRDFVTGLVLWTAALYHDRRS